MHKICDEFESQVRNVQLLQLKIIIKTQKQSYEYPSFLFLGSIIQLLN